MGGRSRWRGSSRLGQRALKSSLGGGSAGDTPSSPPSGTFVTLPCSVMQAWNSSQTQEASDSVTSGSHAVHTMENILSSLSSLAETWLTFGSASYHIDLNDTLLGGLGLLLLYVCYLIVKLLLQLLWRKEYTQKVRK